MIHIMADLGGNKYPIKIVGITETKERKRLWIEARIKETEAKVANLKHALLGEEQMIVQLKIQYDLNEKAIDV